MASPLNYFNGLACVQTLLAEEDSPCHAPPPQAKTARRLELDVLGMNQRR